MENSKLIKNYYLRKYLRNLVNEYKITPDNYVHLRRCNLCKTNIIKGECDKCNGYAEILFPDTETKIMNPYYRTCLEYIGKAIGERLEQDLYNDKLTIRKK